MDPLRKPIRQAQWRAAMQLFLDALGYTLLVTLLLAGAVLLFDRLYLWELDARWVIASAVGSGVFAAAGWALLRSPRAEDAAYQIDYRFRLDDRVTSAVLLPEEFRDTPAGKALRRDAQRRLQRVDVATRFPIRPSLRLLWPVPAVVALLGAMFLVQPVRGKTSQPPQAAESPGVEKSVEEIQQQLATQNDSSEAIDPGAAEQLLARLQEQAEKLAQINPEQRKEALVELNDLQQQLEQRREELLDRNRLADQLRQLENIERGPADKLVEALRRGDMGEVTRQMEALREQLEKEALQGEQQKRLAEQLDQLQKKLEEAAKRQQEAAQGLEEQLAQAEAAGDRRLAEQLRQQLKELKKQGLQAEQLQQMAQQLRQAAQCMQQGQCQQAAQALQQCQQQLDQLAQQLNQGQLLNQAMQDLDQLRRQMNCRACQGAGCRMCQWAGQRPGRGMGMGEGQGSGPRPIAENDVRFRDSQAPANVGEGALIVSGTAAGPNLRTGVQAEISRQVETARSEPLDPVSTQPVPAPYRDHTREYFDRIREGN